MCINVKASVAYYFAVSLRLCVVMDLEAGFEHVSWRVFEYQETPPPAVQTSELPDEVDNIIMKHMIQFQHIYFIKNIRNRAPPPQKNIKN